MKRECDHRESENDLGTIEKVLQYLLSYNNTRVTFGNGDLYWVGSLDW